MQFLHTIRLPGNPGYISYIVRCSQRSVVLVLFATHVILQLELMGIPDSEAVVVVVHWVGIVLQEQGFPVLAWLELWVSIELLACVECQLVD